jgi:Ni,Fe-hydrogenase III large subunit
VNVTDSYRGRVQEALSEGWRFGGLHAAEQGGVVRALLIDRSGGTRLETAVTGNGECSSIVDLAPAAGWDEREAHDLYGVRFAGHEPLRPLLVHDLDLRDWTVPVQGDDPYQIAVGPIHAGVIESGHFRFHVVGDRILQLDTRLFYKHRGLERAAEGEALDRGIAYAARACAACAVANTLAYAHACEHALGLESSSELARVRTSLLELERTWSHLNDIAAVCSGVGFAAGGNQFASLTEQARRLNAELTGHRFLFGTVRVGGSDLELGRDAVGSARGRLDGLRKEFRAGWRALRSDFSFQDRLPGIGVVGAEEARMLGTVGPPARAAGLAEDARAGAEGLAYDGFRAALQEQPDGDVRARLEQRAIELEQSFELLDELLAQPVRPSSADPGGSEYQIGVGRIESARGETTCILERDGERVGRLRLRTGSYANWPSVAYAAAGNLLPDFPLINKSFELCYACADR